MAFPLERATPASLDLDPKALERLLETVTRHIAEGRYPGAQLAMARRGKLALHIRYGLPMALNAGNWLYFWPFELIRTLELPSETTLSVYEYYHRTRLRAYFGQATLLGPKWFDRVPLLIPLSWFTMSWAAWIIARRRTGAFQAVLLGTCL